MRITLYHPSVLGLLRQICKEQVMLYLFTVFILLHDCMSFIIFCVVLKTLTLSKSYLYFQLFFRPRNNRSVILNINAFSGTCGKRRLIIYDGSSVRSPLLAIIRYDFPLSVEFTMIISIILRSPCWI